jgi:DNA end-binding protein Ku
MPRVIWKGSISFGLVHVPIALYSGEERDELHFTMLDKTDLSPVGYKRVNKTTGNEVPWEDIVRGYEYEKGHYVVLSEEELRLANIEATQTVEIVDFVSAQDIPMVYYDKPYFLEPDKRGEKGYALLRETLRRTKKAGIARLVLRERQHIAVLLPYDDMLLLNLLRYKNELRDTSQFKTPKENLIELGIKKPEMDMAERLVESMVTKWKPEQYHDEYRDDVLQMIDEKIKAGETEVLKEEVSEAPMRKTAEIIDLMAALKKSVQEREKGAKRSSTGGRKKTAARSNTSTSSRGKKASRKRAS